MEKMTSAWFSGSYAVCCCCCSVQIEHSLYTWLPFFPLWFINFFSFILLLFYKRFYVFLAIAIRIYLCFREKVLFQFRNFGFISHATRISNTTSFLWKMVKNKFRNNFSRLTKLKCFGFEHSTEEDLKLQIILDFGKDLLLKTWLKLIVVFKSKKINSTLGL